ncbi:MAG: aldo/keto reductase [Desulfovibrionaceae bacterium]|nr:aldo/keto reductase [Desulfovibrionaceae bacterium]
MEMRDFPGIGRKISLLGFGCMRLPKIVPDKPGIDQPLAEKMIDLALGQGVNYFDTAWPYHDGLSESFLGRTLSRYPRESFNLADKMPSWIVRSVQEVEELFGEQLKKCRVDYFDFYLMHNLCADTYKTMLDLGVYEILSKKKEQGLIRRLGFSFHDHPATLERIAADYPWDFVQIQLNYLDWEDYESGKMYAILSERGIPAVIMEPVRGGALAVLNPQALEILRAANPKVSPASWAIRYAASLPGVLTVLSGMSNLEQVQDNLNTMTSFQPLSEAERATLAEAAAAYRLSRPVPCTGCGYCMDCPSGVNIPKVFAVYNHAKPLNVRRFFEVFYGVIPEGERARNCVACGQCATHCPQNIDIPERMKEIAAEAGIKL